MPETLYSTRRVMELLGIKSRQTLYNRGDTARAVHAFPDGTGPLMWPESVVREMAKEYGVEL